MNEPVLPETRVGFYIRKASCRRLDVMPLPILRDPSSPTQHIRGNTSKCGKEPRNLDRLCLGSMVPSCFCLRPTSQREPCLAHSFPAAAKGGDVGWHLGRVSSWAAFKMAEREEKPSTAGLTTEFQADQRNQGTKLPFQNRGMPALHSRY